MKFIHLTTTSYFFLALTYAAPASDLVVDLDLVFVCEILLDQCPSAILEVLESLPVNTIVTVALLHPIGQEDAIQSQILECSTRPIVSS
jgi:hypothetical protein